MMDKEEEEGLQPSAPPLYHRASGEQAVNSILSSIAELVKVVSRVSLFHMIMKFLLNGRKSRMVVDEILPLGGPI